MRVSASMSKNGWIRDGFRKSIVPRVIAVAVPLEEDLAAIDVGAPEEHRIVVGAVERQVGARDDAREVVLEPQRARRLDLDVEAHRQRRRLRRPRTGSSSPPEVSAKMSTLGSNRLL